jgi:tetratricopeptide (TPR) repeat protein
LGTFYQTLGLLAEARLHYQFALALARELSARRHEAEALGNLGNEAYERGDFIAALGLHRAAFDLYTSLGDKRGQAIELINLANVALESHDDAMAMRLYGQALGLCLETGYRFGQALAVLGQGHVRYHAGEWNIAEKCYREAARLTAELRQPEPQRVAITNLGLVAEREGNLQAAQEYYREAIRLVESGRRSVAREDPRIAYFGRRLTPYERLILIYCHKGHVRMGLTMVEHARARTFLDLLAQARVETEESVLDWTQIKDALAI